MDVPIAAHVCKGQQQLICDRQARTRTIVSGTNKHYTRSAMTRKIVRERTDCFSDPCWIGERFLPLSPVGLQICVELFQFPIIHGWSPRCPSRPSRPRRQKPCVAHRCARNPSLVIRIASDLLLALPCAGILSCSHAWGFLSS